MGADPSLRPNVAAIQKEQKKQDSPVDIPNMARYDNVSAWELVFGNGQPLIKKTRVVALFVAVQE